MKPQHPHIWCINTFPFPRMADLKQKNEGGRWLTSLTVTQIRRSEAL